MSDAIKFAVLAETKHLLLAHHDPFHTDEQLNEMFTDLKKHNNYSFICELAAEGMNVNLA